MFVSLSLAPLCLHVRLCHSIPDWFLTPCIEVHFWIPSNRQWITQKIVFCIFYKSEKPRCVKHIFSEYITTTTTTATPHVVLVCSSLKTCCDWSQNRACQIPSFLPLPRPPKNPLFKFMSSAPICTYSLENIFDLCYFNFIAYFIALYLLILMPWFIPRSPQGIVWNCSSQDHKCYKSIKRKTAGRR